MEVTKKDTQDLLEYVNFIKNLKYPSDNHFCNEVLTVHKKLLLNIIRNQLDRLVN